MRRFLPYLLAVAAAAFALGGSATAQRTPEFRLGFAALAAQIPDTVGTPRGDEQYASNGDSLQATTTGLMVWRKADNWTAFTNGSTTWVNGPLGIQTRSNEERFPWEATTVASPVMPAATSTPTPTSTVVPSPKATAFATPSPTPAPKPNVRGSQPNVIQGQGLDAGRVWVLGEVTNEGTIPAYNVTATARLVDASGNLAGTAFQLFPYLGAGDTVGYLVEVKSSAAYVRADVAVDSNATGFAGFGKLDVAWGKNEQDHTTVQATTLTRYQFTGTVENKGTKALSLNTVYVWFLDDQNRVVWMDYTYLSAALAPGDSYEFTINTPRDRENPQIPAITQVRYYAVGQLR